MSAADLCLCKYPNLVYAPRHHLKPGRTRDHVGQLSAQLGALHPPPKLIFSLSTAQEWKREHNGFHYPTFYNFIVDVFEDVEDDTAQKNADGVLDWWNWYILSEIWKGQSPNN